MTQLAQSSAAQQADLNTLQCGANVLLQLRSSQNGVFREDFKAWQKFPEHIVEATLDYMLKKDIIRHSAPTRRYHLGFAELHSTVDLIRHRELALVAQRALSDLRDLTGESTLIAVDDGNGVETLAHILGPQPDPVINTLGHCFPYHCSATGKIFLAYSTEERREKLLNRPLTKLSDKTIQDRMVLTAQLSEARQRGYAIANQEYCEGQRSIAAPILGSQGELVGAIAVAGPPYRIALSRLPALASATIAAAQQISAELARPDLAPRPPHNATAASLAPSGVTTTPQWSQERGLFQWLDLSERQLWQAKPGEFGEMVHQFNYAPETLVVTSNDHTLVISDTRIENLTAGKSCLIETPILAAVPGNEGDVWAIASRYGEKHLVQFSANCDSVDHAVLPDNVTALCYNPVTASIFLIAPETGQLLSYNLVTRQLKQLQQFSAASGRPVALALAGFNTLWVAFEDGWHLCKLNLQGKLLARVTLPVPSPTGLCFAGHQSATALLTTQRDTLDEEVRAHSPMAGHAITLELDPPSRSPRNSSA